MPYNLNPKIRFFYHKSSISCPSLENSEVHIFYKQKILPVQHSSSTPLDPALSMYFRLDGKNEATGLVRFPIQLHPEHQATEGYMEMVRFYTPFL